MTWPLVILRVNRSSYEDIRRRIIAAGQPDRIFSDGRISVDEVAIEVDPYGPEEGNADHGEAQASEKDQGTVVPRKGKGTQRKAR